MAAEKIVEIPDDSSEVELPDSVSSVESVTEVPKAADEYFNDFIYSFTNNKAYQMSRIVFYTGHFPLIGNFVKATCPHLFLGHIELFHFYTRNFLAFFKVQR